MNVRSILLTLSILLLTLPDRLAADAEHPTSVDFDRDVRPIFETHCLRCHGPSRQRSGLRLDVKASALEGGDVFGPAIVPGNAADSPLIQLVSGEDEDLTMPPKGERLSAVEVQTLTRWIDEGGSRNREAPRRCRYHRSIGITSAKLPVTRVHILAIRKGTPRHARAAHQCHFLTAIHSIILAVQINRDRFWLRLTRSHHCHSINPSLVPKNTRITTSIVAPNQLRFGGEKPVSGTIPGIEVARECDIRIAHEEAAVLALSQSNSDENRNECNQ